MSALGDRKGLRAQPIASMYERLPRGPHGMDPRDVVLHQRMRLQGAITELVADGGYEQTTIKSIIALSGVSRRCFYEQYDNKQECFLAAVDDLAERLGARVKRTCGSIEGGRSERLLGGLGALASEILEHPKQASLLFVHVHSLGTAGAARATHLVSNLEELLLSAFNGSADRDGIPAMLLRAIAGAVAQTVRFAVEENRTSELSCFNERMLDWLLLLQAPTTKPLHELVRAAGPGRVARAQAGAYDLTLEDGDRELLMGSCLGIVQDSGYQDLKTFQIADRAGVDLESFLEIFADQHECFTTALEILSGRALAAIPDSSPSEQWPLATCASIAALLNWLSHDTACAWAIAGGAREGMQRGAEHDRDFRAQVTAKVCAAIPADIREELVDQQLAGALWHTVTSLQLAGRTHLLAALDGYLSYLTLAPLIGADRALAVIELHLSEGR